MKKITALILLLFAFVAFCCSDSDNESNTASLSGKWNLTSITGNQPVDGNGDGVASSDLNTEFGSCYTASYLEFENNNGFINFISQPPSGEQGCYTITSHGEYEQDGNTISTTFNLTGSTYTMVYTLQGDTLTATIQDFYVIPLIINGETQGMYIDATVVFTKQQ